MIKGDSTKHVSVDHHDLIRLIITMSKELDDIDLYEESVETDLYNCYIYACNYPEDFREYRHTLLSRRTTEGVSPNFPLLKLYNQYGYRSIYVNTAARMISLVKLSKLAIANRTKDYLPPAFNNALTYQEVVEPDYNAYILLKKWREIPGLSDIIHKLKNIHKEYKEKYSNRANWRVILLDNSSSQGYTSGTVNVTDLMANVYFNSYLTDPDTGQILEFNHLNKLVGLLNSRSDDDPFFYLSKEGVYDNYKFEVNAIPDKDGKIRFIYQGTNDVQTLSKGIHEMFDTVARKIDGNYTYDQKEWIMNIIDKGWNRTKYIIGTDMTKYSDTLNREFILDILREADFDDEEIRELDILYSLPVKNLNGDIFDIRQTNATYQGQYGDFPLITIANLALQSMVMYIEHSEFGNGRNAAVGDDTGMVFDEYKDSIINTIIKVYGSVGVRINKMKTGELNGKENNGVVDFVKLRFDREGLIKFLEPKPYYRDDFDQAIRDIYDSIFFDDNYKRHMFKIIFNEEVSNHLMDRSIINGGINKRIIEPRDVNELLSTRMMLTDLNKLKFGNYQTWLNQTYKELLDNNCSWRDTVFSELKDAKERRLELEISLGNGDISNDEYEYYDNEAIMLSIAKIIELGSSDAPADFRSLIGQDPHLIYHNHKLKRMKLNYDRDLERSYELIKENDSYLGRLKKRNVKMSRSVYKEKIEIAINSLDSNNWLEICKNMKSLNFSILDMQEYTDNIMSLIISINAYKLVTYLLGTGIIFSRTNKYGEHWYLKFEGQQYRLFDDHPTSKYPLLTNDIKNKIPLLASWDLADLFTYYRQF